MGLLFCDEVFNGAVAGTSANFQYSHEAYWASHARADRMFIQMKTSQASTTPTVQVALETSNDGIVWYNKGWMFIKVLTAGPPESFFSYDDGTYPTGGFIRFRLSMTAGVSPSAIVQLLVAGRDD